MDSSLKIYILILKPFSLFFLVDLKGLDKLRARLKCHSTYYCLVPDHVDGLCRGEAGARPRAAVRGEVREVQARVTGPWSGKYEHSVDKVWIISNSHLPLVEEGEKSSSSRPFLRC